MSWADKAKRYFDRRRGGYGNDLMSGVRRVRVEDDINTIQGIMRGWVEGIETQGTPPSHADSALRLAVETAIAQAGYVLGGEGAFKDANLAARQKAALEALVGDKVAGEYLDGVNAGGFVSVMNPRSAARPVVSQQVLHDVYEARIAAIIDLTEARGGLGIARMVMVQDPETGWPGYDIVGPATEHHVGM